MSILTQEDRKQVSEFIHKIDLITSLHDLAMFEQKFYMAKEDLTHGVFNWTIRAVEVQRDMLTGLEVEPMAQSEGISLD